MRIRAEKIFAGLAFVRCIADGVNLPDSVLHKFRDTLPLLFHSNNAVGQQAEQLRRPLEFHIAPLPRYTLPKLFHAALPNIAIIREEEFMDKETFNKGLAIRKQVLGAEFVDQAFDTADD